jgi:hypothetical protein
MKKIPAHEGTRIRLEALGLLLDPTTASCRIMNTAYQALMNTLTKKIRDIKGYMHGSGTTLEGRPRSTGLV